MGLGRWPFAEGFGARGGIRTRTGDALDVVSLLFGLHERNGTSPAGLFHRLIASVQGKVARSTSRSGMKTVLRLPIGHRLLRRRRWCPEEESNLQPCARPALPAYKAVALPIELPGLSMTGGSRREEAYFKLGTRNGECGIRIRASSPRLLPARELAERRGLAPQARRLALVSTEARPARPVDAPNWSVRGDLHSQGCPGLSRTGLLFPVSHAPLGDPGLAPGRLGDFKSPGSAVPAQASRRENGRRERNCTSQAHGF